MGARRRCEFFQWVFDVPLSVEWRDPQRLEQKNGAATHNADGAKDATQDEQTVKVG